MRVARTGGGDDGVRRVGGRMAHRRRVEPRQRLRPGGRGDGREQIAVRAGPSHVLPPPFCVLLLLLLPDGGAVGVRRRLRRLLILLLLRLERGDLLHELCAA